MIVADALGVPHAQVKVVQCAPDTLLQGNHTGGSRTMVGAGSVCYLAAQKLIEQGKALAALELKLEPSQIAYANGEFRSDESRRTVKLAELAKSKTLSLTAEGKFGSTFPNGCHIAEVEVDPETGARRKSFHTAPSTIAASSSTTRSSKGQLHGGVVQGAGQVFGEHVVYDRESGQPLTASFMDYYMPRAGLLREPARRRTSHAEQGQPARRQGHGRVRLHRFAARARQRGHRRAAAAGHRASRHAADALEAVARDRKN